MKTLSKIYIKKHANNTSYQLYIKLKLNLWLTAPKGQLDFCN